LQNARLGHSGSALPKRIAIDELFVNIDQAFRIRLKRPEYRVVQNVEGFRPKRQF